MKLNQKVFCFESNTDLERAEINILINGKDADLSPKYLFKQLEVEEDKICGYSMLQFYGVKGGDLVDAEGNTLTFMVKEKKVPIVKVRDPLIVSDEDLEVGLQYVKDVSSLLGLEKIEETITGLSVGEKKIIIDDRTEEYSKKELAKKEAEEKAKSEELKAEEEAKAAEAKEVEEKAAAEKAKVIEEKAAAEKAEADAKLAEEKDKAETEHEQQVEAKKIPKGDDILTEKEYRMLFRKFQRIGLNEYKKDEYRFFYGEDIPDGETPIILAKRDGYYQRLDGSLIAEDDKGVEYEFTALTGEDEVLILKDGEISISEL